MLRPEADSCKASVGAEYVGVKIEYSEDGTLRHKLLPRQKLKEAILSLSPKYICI